MFLQIHHPTMFSWMVLLPRKIFLAFPRLIHPHCESGLQSHFCLTSIGSVCSKTSYWRQIFSASDRWKIGITGQSFHFLILNRCHYYCCWWRLIYRLRAVFLSAIKTNCRFDLLTAYHHRFSLVRHQTGKNYWHLSLELWMCFGMSAHSLLQNHRLQKDLFTMD
jgi:hypothetical protein